MSLTLRKRLFDDCGSQAVEMALITLPLMAFLLLIADIAWICFAQLSLQYGIQAGVRAAVTSYIPQGLGGQDAYIKSVVQSNAMGFLRQDTTDLNLITINYYNPSNLSKPVTGSGSNIGGNVVEISVKNVPVSTLGPILRADWGTVYMQATGSDVMEASSNGVPPARPPAR